MSDCQTTVNFSTGQTVTAAIMNSIVPSIVIQPSFVGNKPVVGTLANGDSIFGLSAGNQLQQILYSSLQSQILSSSVGASQSGVYNLLINGDGLVNQRAASYASIAANGYTVDRWKWAYNGSASRATVAPLLPTTVATLPFVSGGPSSASCINITVPSATSTIAAGDLQFMTQLVEYSLLEPVLNGPLSFSFIYNTNFSGVISVALRDDGFAHSYVVPVTLTGDSAWHLVQIQNISSIGAQTWTNLGNMANGSLTTSFCLLSGTGAQTGTTGAWVAGNFIAANNQGNLLASTSNFLKIAQCMLNPGPTCVPYYSEPFTPLLAKCKRYYQKSYINGTYAGAVDNTNCMETACLTTAICVGVKLPVDLRATPSSVNIYSANSGAVGKVYNVLGAVDSTITTPGAGPAGFQEIGGGTFTAAASGFANTARWQYTLDADF